MNNYLIPANSKKGQLILGMFRSFDLALLITGVMITFILLAFVPVTSTLNTILILIPGVVSAILVAPIPYYHNVLTMITELYDFLTSRRTYRWKGWCYKEWLKK